MLYRHSEVLRSIIMGIDVLLVAIAWMAAYGLRFHAGIPAPLGIPDFDRYLDALIVICPLWWWLLRRHGLYEAKRLESIAHEAVDVLRVTAIALLMLVAIGFSVRSYFYSRGAIAIPLTQERTGVESMRPRSRRKRMSSQCPG